MSDNRDNQNPRVHSESINEEIRKIIEQIPHAESLRESFEAHRVKKAMKIFEIYLEELNKNIANNNFFIITNRLNEAFEEIACDAFISLLYEKGYYVAKQIDNTIRISLWPIDVRDKAWNQKLDWAKICDLTNITP